MKLDTSLLLKLFIYSVVSGAVAYYAQPLIHDNQDAADVLVNVFSILAGFLVAVMTIMGEPIFYRSKTWRYNQARRNNYKKGLARHKILFQGYLITLALIFSSRLIDAEANAACLVWIERGYLFLSVITFVMSLSLPDKLISVQLKKFDEQVNDKKSGGPE